MKLKYLLCIFFFIIQGGILFSQEFTDTNLSLINKLLNESLVSLDNKLLLFGKENFYRVEFESENDESLYFLENVRNKFHDFKIITGEDSDSIDYRIEFKNLNIKTKYDKIFTDKIYGTKKVSREVSLIYDLNLIDKKTSSVVYSQNFNKKTRDNFDLDKLNMVEDKRFSFSRSILPEESPITRLLYPAIIIVASAVAIILFFTIRSK